MSPVVTTPLSPLFIHPQGVFPSLFSHRLLRCHCRKGPVHQRCADSVTPSLKRHRGANQAAVSQGSHFAAVQQCEDHRGRLADHVPRWNSALAVTVSVCWNVLMRGRGKGGEGEGGGWSMWVDSSGTSPPPVGSAVCRRTKHRAHFTFAAKIPIVRIYYSCHPPTISGVKYLLVRCNFDGLVLNLSILPGLQRRNVLPFFFFLNGTHGSLQPV